MAIETSKDPQAFTEFEYRGWETISSSYEQHFAHLTSQSVSAVLDAANVGRGMALLDVCTGPGMLAAGGTARGARVIGLDFSAEAIDIARRNVLGAEFREGNAQALPFEDNCFDAVVCGFGIIHLPQPEQALSEMRRVLKPQGQVALSVWEAPKATNGFGLLFGALKVHGDLSVPLPHGPDFFQFSDNVKFSTALKNTGFREISVKTVEQIWEQDEPSGMVKSISEGSVRARGLLLAQTEAARTTIAEAVVADMGQYRSSDGRYRVPMPALIGAGVK